MGEHLHTTLYVLEEHKDKVLKILQDHNEEPDESEMIDQLNEVTQAYFIFYECRYGNLDSETIFREEGIPYEKDWCSGYEIGPGTETLRILEDGSLEIKKIYDSEAGIPVTTLLPIVKDHDALTKVILEKEKQLKVEPWKDQLERHKIYQATKLISPQEDT